ncbi:MAG: hypothetical protein FWG69_01515 [Oscillospiraceae bacterium]|nr:hypothetical protein [Oscillospiraceae bacterium]
MDVVKIKITRVESKAVGFFQKNADLAFFLIITVAALAIRACFIYYESEDYSKFLEPWVELIKEHGGFASLGVQITDYNIPYTLYLTIISYLPVSPLWGIKVLSIVFDFVLAGGCVLIVCFFFKKSSNKIIYAALSFAVILLLPVVIMNSAAWAQCDSIYTAFIILTLYCLLKEKYTLSFVFFAAAICFKLQAVFFFPVFVILYLTGRKFSLMNLLIIPAILAAAGLPAALAGRSVASIAGIYINQTATYNHLTMNYANIYNFLPELYDLLKPVGIMFTFVLLGVMTYYLVRKKYTPQNVSLVGISLWVVFTCVLFLPKIHDRHAYMADILSVLYFITRREKILIPIGINFVSICSYFPYLFGYSAVDFKILTAINVFVYIYFTYELIKTLRTENNQMNPPTAESIGVF